MVDSPKDSAVKDVKSEESAQALAADHAKDLGLKPGHCYLVHSPNPHAIPPVVGKLVGTNDLGVMIRPENDSHIAFHPWHNVAALVHE